MTQGNYLPSAVSAVAAAMHRSSRSFITVDTRSSDQMKVVDPDVWGEELWTPELTMGSEFSPHMGTDLCGTTVSPSEITMNPTMPTPTFSSPYLFDSPSEGYETSPLFGADDVNGADNWYSLFPESNQDSEDSTASPLMQGHQDMAGDIIVKDDSRESTGSPETSPKFLGSGRIQKRSSTSGVRKRQQPLPPIVVEDPSDIVALKRARNTLAARKSRAKKAEKMDEMEAMIEDLKAQVEHWKNIAMSK
jgi:general control protein GCN4